MAIPAAPKFCRRALHSGSNMVRRNAIRIAAVLTLTGCTAGTGQQMVYDMSGGAVRSPGLSSTPQIIPGVSNPREYSRAQIEDYCDGYSRRANSGAIANSSVHQIAGALVGGPPIGNPTAASQLQWDLAEDRNKCITALTPGRAPPELQRQLLEQMNLATPVR